PLEPSCTLARPIDLSGGGLKMPSLSPASLSARLPLACVAIALLFALGPPPAWARDRGDDCRVGSYRLDDGSQVDVGAGNDDHLRWRRLDGTTGELTRGAGDTWTSTLGWTGRDDGKRVDFDCGSGRITFDGIPGRRIALDVTDTSFDGAGVRLAGRLVMPAGDARVPVVVLVHG